MQIDKSYQGHTTEDHHFLSSICLTLPGIPFGGAGTKGQPWSLTEFLLADIQEATIVTRSTVPQHCHIHKTASMAHPTLFQLFLQQFSTLKKITLGMQGWP